MTKPLAPLIAIAALGLVLAASVRAAPITLDHHLTSEQGCPTFDTDILTTDTAEFKFPDCVTVSGSIIETEDRRFEWDQDPACHVHLDPKTQAITIFHCIVDEDENLWINDNTPIPYGFGK